MRVDKFSAFLQVYFYEFKNVSMFPFALTKTRISSTEKYLIHFILHFTIQDNSYLILVTFGCYSVTFYMKNSRSIFPTKSPEIIVRQTVAFVENK